MRMYRPISFILMVVFAITGLLFLGFPDKALSLFNTLASSFGMLRSPVGGWSFYLILAVAYMYLVSALAFLMFKHPENHYFPLLLTHAKLASSLLSLALFLFQAHYLVYMVNFIVDGVIGLVVLTLYLKMRKTEWAYS
jgi:hypothetical protein